MIRAPYREVVSHDTSSVQGGGLTRETGDVRQHAQGSQRQRPRRTSDLHDPLFYFSQIPACKQKPPSFNPVEFLML